MPHAAETQVTPAVERYVLAMSTGDEDGLRAAFHANASVMGNYQGAVEWLSLDAYVAEVIGASLPPNNNPKWSVTSIDITDDAASVKMEDEFGSMRFTNYLSLLRIAGEWKIVSKLYHPST
ncbi:nuclear transport factor 2 family protein [Mesorhizobium loti]|uniref:nuclear transport factor 2 family protein n=1 Tax=Rhizobium loti TaxID=381 RepID=UPI00047C82C2|nr:nuclear transport factor 2 family protein [Mesorhizobium loti]